MPTNLTAEKLAAPGSVLNFGSAHGTGHVTAGEIYDELRVSRTIRYTKDFTPPSEPFRADEDTYVLMHLDGDVTAKVDGREVTGEMKTGVKMGP